MTKTDNLPSTINQEELAAFIAANRISQEDLNGGGGDFLPQLKANYADEEEIDGQKYELKLGYFVVNTPDHGNVYAKNVNFRPLLHNYQYIDYDREKEEVVCRTILFNDFKDEPRDEHGTLRCGKPQSKLLKDNAALKKQWEHVNLYRSVDGLVNYTGTTADGKEVKVENLLVTFRGKGSNFSPFQDEYTSVMPKGALLWDYDLKLSTTKHKQDPKSIVSYYIVHFEADFSKKLPFTVTEFETVKALQARIEATNKEIDTKYYTALETRNKTDAAVKALDITPTGSLSDDFGTQDDDLPF